MLEEPPIYPPCVVAGNYEPENNKDELICPLCHQPSGWNLLLWQYNIPTIGLYCSNCKDLFYEFDYYNG